MEQSDNIAVVPTAVTKRRAQNMIIDRIELDGKICRPEPSIEPPATPRTSPLLVHKSSSPIANRPRTEHALPNNSGSSETALSKDRTGKCEHLARGIQPAHALKMLGYISAGK